MDTITHTLFGLTLYGALDKRNLDPSLKKSLFAASLIGSQIPDIDFVVSFTEIGDTMYQMWHRGLTHSVFLVPVWSLLIWLLCYLVFKRKDAIIYKLSLVAVAIHIGSDGLNTWGTGLLEPFSQARFTYGAIPIVDLVFWVVILFGWLARFVIKRYPPHYMMRAAWAVMALHVLVQSAQVYAIHAKLGEKYDQIAVAAGFVPTQFQVFGKTEGSIDMFSVSGFGQPQYVQTLPSADDADLTPLFAQNPKAEVLYTWSPFVVVVNDEHVLGIYDPRFYRGGDPMLAEYIEK
ncbi:metal-dependent hydrolase [Brevibacillus sp. TJ4]|uniref:metal-dependent hydrolase n=1 Tax=Brevibacillus sp. TJ4 TaxID=3234853 RepID=UPI0037D97652